MKALNRDQLKDFLESKVDYYNTVAFVDSDPIQVPHYLKGKENIEIAGFLTACISWGKRKSIVNNAFNMIHRMEFSPYDFVMNHSSSDLDNLNGFVHRTFNDEDLKQFVISLKHLYQNHGGLEGVFNTYAEEDNLQFAIHKLKFHFFEIPHLQRTVKHLADPLKNSAAKRINMFLRWMVREDNAGVDFGLWKNIRPAQLSCPLDVHTGNVARKLGLLKRKQNDAKAVLELDTALRSFDPVDPVKYDFALFGLGVFEDF
ncbi:MAG: TIGR02757 family protein [Bacteroidia bacterium]|nr:TIGR02757 family protein [Bacteroidia bacterium]NNF81297.1 TIGR02757 family protein [Flavobacteriaceae bacterium]NNK70895.1 TIGR02757 family protein [Flavobacteriaceae bacterium]NNL79902.1 TIGR02757 family protein [Flavobacteriaceae bacterium]